MKLLRAPEVAERLRVPVETLRYWRWRDEGPASFKVGRSVVYDEADVDAWIEAQKRSTTSGSAVA